MRVIKALLVMNNTAQNGGYVPPKYECSVAGVVGFDKVIEKIERSGCPAHGVEFC